MLSRASFALDSSETVYSAEDYQFILLEDGTAKIIKYTGKDKEVVLPEKLNNETVSTIGNETFRLQSGIERIVIPASISVIESNPFVGCKYLNSFYLAPNHPTLAIIDGVLYSKSDKRLIICPRNTSSCEVPQGIRIIEDAAFENCKNLSKVSIPDSVSSIGNLAFSGCSSLTSIEIPDSVLSIGNSAFYSCNSLTSIEIPESVSSIGECTFTDCGKLESIAGFS